MKVSILLPVSNNQRHCKETIKSILDQDYKNFELLICFNGNTNAYEKNIKRTFSRNKKIKFFKISEKNIVPALNKLINEAKGQYCARIDADDLSKKNRISSQIEYIRKNKSDFLSTNCEVVGNKNEVLYQHETNFRKSLYTNPIVHPTIMVKTSHLKKYGYKRIPYAEDYELYLRMWLDGIDFNNLEKNLLEYKLNISNIKNYKRSFYLILATLIISKGFRTSNEVNESFFKKVKIQKYFKKSYKIYVNNFLLSKGFKRYISIIYLFIFGNFLIKKNISNKLFYFYKNLKIPKSSQNKKVKRKIFNALVSFVIPTYNSHRTIYQTIKSIKSQTYKNIEIIVVDNSQDNLTIDIINKHFSNVKIVKIKKKILPAEARNIGVKNTSKNAHFVSFCDSDDIIKPNKTEIQVNIMLKENLNASCTNVDVLNQQTGNLKKNFFVIPFRFIDFEILSYKNLIATSSVMISKKIFNSVNGFSESKYFYSFEDYFLWLKIVDKVRFRFIDQNLTIYRDDRKNSASSLSKHIVEQRLRLFFFYLLSFKLKNIFKIIYGNFLLVKSWTTRKIFKWRRSEYFDLL